MQSEKTYQQLASEKFMEGKALETMFAMQEATMELLKAEGKISNYPLDLKTREAQTTLRSFMGFFVEELAELHTAYAEIVTAHNLGEEREVIDRGIRAANEEAADTLHFALEILILTGIDIELIAEEVYSNLKELNFFEAFGYTKKNLLLSICSFGAAMNTVEGKHLNRKDFYVYDNPTNDPTLTGCNKVSDLYTELFAAESFLIIKAFQQGINMLKMKPWRLSGPALNIDLLKSTLVEAFVAYIAFLDLMGLDAKSIFFNYVLKNEIVNNRILDKY